MSKSEFAALANDAGAARSWTKTALTNSLGATVGRPAPTAGGGVVKYGVQSMSFGDVNVMRIYESSNIDPSVQQASSSGRWPITSRARAGSRPLTCRRFYLRKRHLINILTGRIAFRVPFAVLQLDIAYAQPAQRIQATL